MLKYNCFCLVCFTILVTGCDFYGSKPDPPVTEILEIRVEPNPVAVADTARFTCIIRDSLKGEVLFDWNLGSSGGSPNTATNYLEWVAPTDTGTYNFSVQVEPVDPSDGRIVGRSFQVTVVQSQHN